MVKIRLKRMGSKKNAFYRIVVSDARVKRDGKIIQQLGYYDPMKATDNVKLDKEAALSWLQKGAQPTTTARNILSQFGVMEAYHLSKAKTKKS